MGPFPSFFQSGNVHLANGCFVLVLDGICKDQELQNFAQERYEKNMYHESNCRISPQTFLSFHVSCCVPGHVLRTHGSRPSTHHPLHSGISWPKKRVAIWKGQLLDLKAHGCTQLQVGYLEPTRWPWPYQGFVLQADLDCSINFFP